MPVLKIIRRPGRKFLQLLPCCALLAMATPAAAAPFLGGADNFAVLGTNAATVNSATTLKGDIGLSLGTTITGDAFLTLNPGTRQLNNAVAVQAQTDATAAYNILAGLTPTTNLSGDLNGITLSPGVFSFGAAFGLTGVLTLDYGANPGGSFVFQIGAAMNTAAGSSIVVLNGGSNSGIYWQALGAVGLGANSVMVGNIITQAAITTGAGSKILCGRVMGINGISAITMDANTISRDCTAGGDFASARSDFGSAGFSGDPRGTPVSVPEPASLLLLTMGVAGLALVRRRQVAA